ncbi:hypothetical protein ACO0QE_000075 [Hanseniaspora vineae]
MDFLNELVKQKNCQRKNSVHNKTLKDQIPKGSGASPNRKRQPLGTLNANSHITSRSAKPTNNSVNIAKSVERKNHDNSERSLFLAPTLKEGPQGLKSSHLSKPQKSTPKSLHAQKADIFQFERHSKKITGNTSKKKHQSVYKELAFLKVLKDRKAQAQAPIYYYNSVRFPRVSVTYTSPSLILALQNHLKALELKCKLETTPLTDTEFDLKTDKFKFLGALSNVVIIQDLSSQPSRLWYLQQRNAQTLQPVLSKAKSIDLSSEYCFPVCSRTTWCIKWRYH